MTYILANYKHGTLYIGVTSDLTQRLWKHRNGVTKGFVNKYGVYKLVYFEAHDSMKDAIIREKQLKRWNRIWKIRLIETINPEWDDLGTALLTGSPPARG